MNCPFWQMIFTVNTIYTTHFGSLLVWKFSKIRGKKEGKKKEKNKQTTNKTFLWIRRSLNICLIYLITSCYFPNFIFILIKINCMNVMWSRETSVKMNMWHFYFSLWLKCSFGEVHFAENPTWIRPMVLKLWAIEGFSKQ